MRPFLLLVTLFSICFCYPEKGKWNFIIDKSGTSVSLPKSLFKGSQIFIQVTCTSNIHDSEINITWSLTEFACWDDYLQYLNKSPDALRDLPGNRTVTAFVPPTLGPCSGHLKLHPLEFSKGSAPNSTLKEKAHPKEGDDYPVAEVPKDGFYMLKIEFGGTGFSTEIFVEMRGAHGYLSAADWPLLPFYGFMSLLYVLLGLLWLLVSFCQWRDLLRIQFWIGAVIFLGMLEKATYYAVYYNINKTGMQVDGVVIVAEFVSCGKRTLARMLVIIVSHGFGIVKPRLGSLLHRVSLTGALYLLTSLTEAYIRVMHPSNDPSSDLLMVGIVLAVLDSFICWWLFTTLVQTTRTLRLRRNMVKLQLYRHFTNTLIFAVLSSIVFMAWHFKAHRMAACLKDWKELWVNEAFWHILFSIILIVIMILWRPTNNNQRYAFTPLLDNGDDDEDEHFISDAYGIKMRNQSPKPSVPSDDEDIKWVNENIPSAGMDSVLPVLDSDEEVLTTKFEVSKML